MAGWVSVSGFNGVFLFLKELLQSSALALPPCLTLPYNACGTPMGPLPPFTVVSKHLRAASASALFPPPLDLSASHRFFLSFIHSFLLFDGGIFTFISIHHPSAAAAAAAAAAASGACRIIDTEIGRQKSRQRRQSCALLFCCC